MNLTNYMVDHINNGEKLTGRLVNSKDIRDKFIAYSGNFLLLHLVMNIRF